MLEKKFSSLSTTIQNSIKFSGDEIEIVDPIQLRNNIEKLIEISVLEGGEKQALARYLVRKSASQLGIFPSSIHNLYIARGKGEIPSNFTVPAINLRVLTFEAAKAVFRAAMKLDAGAILFEIARSEIGYTDQRPSEYSTNIFGAAIAEGYKGPVFIQGDHFQISAGRFENEPAQELDAVKALAREAIHAGFYNIDVDTSTMVDLSYDSIADQQKVNIELSTEITAFIREYEPENVDISIGGEIGEVGGKNSTEEELRAYLDGYVNHLESNFPGLTGLSKVSIQTGTSHGGTVLPDGSIANISVDFDTLLKLSQVARNEYNLAGAVQHGASTLPQEAFGKFVESEACEVHLATNFQNIFYNLVPQDLKSEIYEYLEKNHQNERKSDMTDEQFYYKSRKRALGPFKKEIWNLSSEDKDKISSAWEEQFTDLFTRLSIAGTNKFAIEYSQPTHFEEGLDYYLLAADSQPKDEDTSDLAD